MTDYEHNDKAIRFEQDKLQADLDRKLNLSVIRAVLGDSAGVVYDPFNPNSGYVQVRQKTSNGLGTAQRVRGPYQGSGVTMTAGTAVILKYDSDGQLYVAAPDFQGVASVGGNPLQSNASDANGSGWTNQSSIVTLLTHSQVPPSLSVVLKGWKPIVSGTLYDFPGASVDLTAFVPSAGNHRIIVLSIKSDYATIEATGSTAKSLADPITIADVQEAITGRSVGSLSLWAWHLHDAQSTITDADIFLDLRQVWNTTDSTISPLTAKGDLFGYSTLNARVPIGADTYVLTADSAQALGLKWAASSGGGGGASITKTTKNLYTEEVIYDNTLGAAGNWDVSSISGTYDHLRVILTGRATVNSGGVGANVDVTFNNDTTAGNYTFAQVYGNGAAATGSSANSTRIWMDCPDTGATANRFGTGILQIPNYTLAVHKTVEALSSSASDNAANEYVIARGVTWKDTSAITRIKIHIDGGTDTFVTGSRLMIIGVKVTTVVTDVTGTGTVMATQTTTATVSNSTVETSLVGTVVGSASIAANGLIVGRTLRGRLSGTISSLAITPGNITLKVKLGSTVILSTGAVALVAALSGAQWVLEYDITCRSTGGSGSVFGWGKFSITSALADVVEVLNSVSQPVTIDSTILLLEDATVQFSSASASNSISGNTGVLEILN